MWLGFSLLRCCYLGFPQAFLRKVLTFLYRNCISSSFTGKRIFLSKISCNGSCNHEQVELKTIVAPRLYYTILSFWKTTNKHLSFCKLYQETYNWSTPDCYCLEMIGICSDTAALEKKKKPV